MKIVGQMAICKFPLIKMTLSNMCKYCDEVYLRFDGLNGNYGILRHLQNICDNKLKQVLISYEPWNHWNWREEMLRMLDKVRANIVISLDEDETFETSVKQDLDLFIKDTTKKCMIFDYVRPMPTSDGSIILNGDSYPLKPHCKVYKWQKRLTYNPYPGRAKLPEYINPECHFESNVKIKHYCFYEKEWMKEKMEIVDKNYGKDYFIRKYIKSEDNKKGLENIPNESII